MEQIKSDKKNEIKKVTVFIAWINFFFNHNFLSTNIPFMTILIIFDQTMDTYLKILNIYELNSNSYILC